MKKYLFKNDKNIYKANLHCHTTFSDGTFTPEKTKSMYMEKGYSIVAFTDHNVLKNHSYLNEIGFLALNACEVNINKKGQPDEPSVEVKTYHFNLYSSDPKITQTPPRMQMDYDDIDAINQYIQDRVNEGFLVCYNHPYWSMQTYADYSGLLGCFAMEIYNNGCEVSDGYYGYNPQAYDEMLRCGKKIFCVSADDNHNRNVPSNPEGDSFGGFVKINADSLNYGDVINSIRTGNFYSSQGPDIYSISIIDDMLRVECSDVCLIVVYTDTRVCYCKKGATLNEAEFTLKGNEKYIRVMCRDKYKHDANSNAYIF